MLTLPNFLTLLRIIAIPLFLVFLADRNYAAAFLLFMAAGITDTVDGAVARLTDSRSDLGAVLDPVADKLLLLSSFVVMGLNGAIPVTLVVLVVSRDVIILMGYLIVFLVHQKMMEVDPSRLGKVNTFFQLATIAFVLMHLARPSLPLEGATALIEYITAGMTAASGIQYVYRGLLWHQRLSADAAR